MKIIHFLSLQIYKLWCPLSQHNCHSELVYNQFKHIPGHAGHPFRFYPVLKNYNGIIILKKIQFKNNKKKTVWLHADDVFAVVIYLPCLSKGWGGNKKQWYNCRWLSVFVEVIPLPDNCILCVLAQQVKCLPSSLYSSCYIMESLHFQIHNCKLLLWH